MKLKFQSDLAYQHQAISSIVDIFEGQPVSPSNFTVSYSEESGLLQSALGVGNNITLTKDEILSNVQKIQMKNGLVRSQVLDGMNFTVEMETGTGKTYVYLRTVYELNRKYGFSKFVVVVPSVAIREGVNKSLDIMADHFRTLYDNKPIEYFVYDSQDLNRVRNFAAATAIQVMIINIDAFRKSFTDPEKEDKANVIHRPQDKLNGYRPIDFIQQTNPIVIIDEPQSVDTTDKAKEAIASLNPLCTLRYSATHVDKYNMLYRLDAVDAYEQKLVKKIEVISIRSEESFNKPYIKLVEVGERKAKIEIDIEDRNGKVSRKTKLVKMGDDLYDHSGERSVYRNYIIEDINWGSGSECIEVSGHLLRLGEAIGDINEDEIKRYQIRKTIEEHLDKELLYTQYGIKVLSLFFIDKVANYRDYDKDGNPVRGKYSIMFEEEYRKLMSKQKYQTLFNVTNKVYDIDEIHNGYFAQDKKGKIKDTKGNTDADKDVYSLIMKDKEKLLSLSEPLKFIFSHSALREGWDNPNVFQICTLKDSGGTYVSRRQEIGRGLRLAVNQSGERISDYNLNTLTVMANESYQEFVEGLQTEIEKDTNIKFGVIEKHTFAKLIKQNEEEEHISFGYDLSEKLYADLKNSQYIDAKGKVTTVLKEAIENYSVQLREEFDEWKPQIIHELKRLITRLPIKDGTKKQQVKLNKAVLYSEDFKLLWDKIKYKTVYSVEFDSVELIRKCVNEIKRMNQIKKIQLTASKARVNIEREEVSANLINEKPEDFSGRHEQIPLPDVITELQNRTRLTRKTIVQILLQSNRLEDFKNNPQRFIDTVTKIIQREMKLVIKDGIRYEMIGDNEYYAVEQFENEELLAYLNDNAVKAAKTPFDHVIYDSNIEKAFAQKFENDQDVRVYMKLPNWFKIDTPVGKYNPDWAVLIDKDGEEKLYFVLETKGTDIEGFLRPEEQAKISFARKHFEAINVDVKFEGPESDPSKFMREKVYI
jgi:type III restriction enzyme